MNHPILLDSIGETCPAGQVLKMTSGGTIVCEPVADDAGETVAIQQNPTLSPCEQCINDHIYNAYIYATATGLQMGNKPDTMCGALNYCGLMEQPLRFKCHDKCTNFNTMVRTKINTYVKNQGCYVPSGFPKRPNCS